MRAIRNRVYGNPVTGVQIPPHPPIYIVRPYVGGFFVRMSRFKLRKACFQRTGLLTLASSFTRALV